MKNKYIVFLCVAIAACVVCAATAGAAEGAAKSFWQKLFNYPANVTKESVNVIADTGKKGTETVVNEVKTFGQVTSGDTDKAKDLVTEPVKGTVETARTAVEGTANVPVTAAKE